MIYEYISSILMMIGIDIVLGGDNAVVIALASRNLPEPKRNMAIALGTTLAILVRSVLTVAVVYLLKIPFLQLIGGLVLLWVSFKLLIQTEGDSVHVQPGTTLWKAVQTIVIADIVMGLDNVIAIAGVAHGNTSLVVFGFLFSVPIIVLGSKIILYWLERYPILVYIGAAILAYTAGQMIQQEHRIQPLYEQFSYFKSILPFITVIAIILAGSIIKRRKISSHL